MDDIARFYEKRDSAAAGSIKWMVGIMVVVSVFSVIAEIWL